MSSYLSLSQAAVPHGTSEHQGNVHMISQNTSKETLPSSSDLRYMLRCDQEQAEFVHLSQEMPTKCQDLSTDQKHLSFLCAFLSNDSDKNFDSCLRLWEHLIAALGYGNV